MPMSDEHKAALAEGRRQAFAVRRYLDALSQQGAGSRKTLEQRLKDLESRLEEAKSSLRTLELRQRIIDTKATLEAMKSEEELAAIEAGFVESAARYAKRKGISYEAWRQSGVPAAVLKKAGISR